jgi:hypothetical protein
MGRWNFGPEQASGPGLVMVDYNYIVAALHNIFIALHKIDMIWVFYVHAPKGHPQTQ